MTHSHRNGQDSATPFVLHTRVVTGTGGGPEKTILNSPRYLRRFGLNAACLFMHPPQDPGFRSLQTRAAAADAEILGVDDRGPLDPGVLKTCLRIYRRLSPTMAAAISQTDLVPSADNLVTSCGTAAF